MKTYPWNLIDHIKTREDLECLLTAVYEDALLDAANAVEEHLIGLEYPILFDPTAQLRTAILALLPDSEKAPAP